MTLQSVLTVFFYFIVYSFLGWLLESLYQSLLRQKLINRGILLGPFCPIYGLSALLLLLLYQLVPFIGIMFLLSIAVTSLVEYFSSWLVEKCCQLQFWNYRRAFLNIHGRISLGSSVIWGVLSVILIDVIHPQLSRLFSGISPLALLIICCLFVVYIITDLSFCANSLLILNRRLAAITKIDQTMQYRHERVHEMLDTAASTLQDRRMSLMENCTWVHQHYLFVYPFIHSAAYGPALQELVEYYRSRSS